MNRRDWAFLLIVAALVLAVGIWYLLSQSLGVAPDFSLTDLEGNTFRLSDFRGKVILIDFMATWCGPCRTQVPILEDVWKEYSVKIVLVSIDVDPTESEDMLRSFIQGFPSATWVWARDTANVAVDYRVTAIPTIVIVDPEGLIRYWHAGVTGSSTLIQYIESLSE